MITDGILTDVQRAEIWTLDAANAKIAEDIARISRDRYLIMVPGGIPADEKTWYDSHKGLQLSMVNAIVRNNARIEALFNEWASTLAA